MLKSQCIVQRSDQDFSHTDRQIFSGGEGSTVRAISLDRDVWLADFGGVDELTITVEPGDRLNPPATG